ncbi:MAG: phosphoribosylformylglycinamidine synthase subunit PurQ [Planctomycetota bacterium]
MAQPKVLVLRSPGANCDEETAEAFRLAGALPERVHVNRLLENPQLLEDYQVLCVPGGFSYGDDIGAGRVLGNQLRLKLSEPLDRFKEAGNLALGICNGLQVLLKTGLLDLEDDAGPRASLTWNDHGRYEARWVHTTATPGDCVFLQDIERIELPIAHAEGKIAVRDDAALDALASAGRIVLRYTDSTGGEPDGFPANPNGSAGHAAGLTDATGRVLGLMPHPERYLYATQHPSWTRGGLSDGDGGGMPLFRNAVAYFG